MAMSGAAHRRHLRDRARAFADAVRNVDPAATVPDCPGWTVRDLVEHTGGLYRWSARLVADRVVAETWRSQMDLDRPPADASADDLADWVDAAIDPMLAAFDVDDWTPVWTWGQSQQAGFWPRRMLFETVVHAVDLARAARPDAPLVIELDPELATDCLDEHFEHLPARGRWARERDPEPLRGTVVLEPTDAATTWRIRCRPTGMWWDRGADRADVTLRGPIGELISLVHQRGRLDRPVGADRVEVDGDLGLATAWLERLAF